MSADDHLESDYDDACDVGYDDDDGRYDDDPNPYDGTLSDE